MVTDAFRGLGGPFVGRRNALLAMVLGLSGLVACDPGGGLRLPRSNSGGATGGTSEATWGNLGSAASGGTGGTSGFPMVVVTGSYAYHCVLGADQTIHCFWCDWNSDDDTFSCPHEDSDRSLPTGTFTSLSMGSLVTCGVRTDGTLACSSNSNFTLPTGTFKAVSIEDRRGCALRTNGTITCWSETGYTPLVPPAGTFISVSVSGDLACAVKTDGTVACWSSGEKSPEPIAGTFTALSVGSPVMCGIRRSDGTLACAKVGGGCAGDIAQCPEAIPPAGTFTAVSVGSYFACGIRTDGTLACWPDWSHPIPTDTFASVSVGWDGACGVRTDGNVACWVGPHR
jgi:hypothetical protein